LIKYISVLFVLLSYPFFAVADMALFVACEPNNKNSKPFTLEIHPLAIESDYAPQCAESKNPFIMTRIDSIDHFERYPSPHEVDMFEKLWAELGVIGGTVNKPSRTSNVVFTLPKEHASKFHEWTALNTGKTVILAVENRLVAIASLMEPISDGKLMFGGDVPLSQAEKLASEIEKTYILNQK